MSSRREKCEEKYNKKNPRSRTRHIMWLSFVRFHIQRLPSLLSSSYCCCFLHHISVNITCMVDRDEYETSEWDALAHLLRRKAAGWKWKNEKSIKSKVFTEIFTFVFAVFDINQAWKSQERLYKNEKSETYQRTVFAKFAHNGDDNADTFVKEGMRLRIAVMSMC